MLPPPCQGGVVSSKSPFSEDYTHAGRREDLVSGEKPENRNQGLHIGGHVRHGLGPHQATRELRDGAPFRSSAWRELPCRAQFDT